MTRVITTAPALREACDTLRAQHGRVGLVPTMGALHAGHLSLIEATRERGAAAVVVSVFVNPTQFGEGEDFERYPRTFEADLAHCRELGVDLVYAPDTASMYPPGYQSRVEVTELTRRLEGAFRPTHFAGVTTVVTKLWNAVGPCVAAFGRKDYQQWQVLARMARDLDMPVEVVGCPIVREADGLAMSSRNRYLQPAERQAATALYQGLCAADQAFRAGERDAAALLELARAPVARHFDRIDYVELVGAEDLEPLEGRVETAAAVLMAAHLGRTRLIDNTRLGHDAL
ncbi:MAG: pantoate--beta-alanine ligase [Myxococcales bacterium]|nr:pantoate--beta-alanine ligase [Myxococcales bacterium]